MRRNSLRISAFATLLALPLAAAGQNFNVHMNILDADVTDGSGNRSREVERSIQTGFAFWETTLPWMGVALTRNPSGTNFKVNVGNYHQEFQNGTFCGRLSWACTDRHSTIDVNSHNGGQLRLHVNDMDFANRDAFYNAYQPATVAPFYYLAEAGNKGHIQGYHNKGFMQFDWIHTMGHEVFHVLGMDHDNRPVNELVTWYNRPYYFSNGIRLAPAQPFLTAANYGSLYTQDMNTIFNGAGFGGGKCILQNGKCETNNSSYTNRVGHPDRWFPDFRWSHFANSMSFMFTAENLQPGMPPLSPGYYNSRVVAQWDADLLRIHSPEKRVEYPGIRGLIRMQQSANGPVHLTSDWQDAYTRTGLRNDVQGSSPFYVTGVFPRARARRVISAGHDASFGVKSDGSLYAWGGNSGGKLGLGNTTNRSNPTAHSTGNWGTVSASENHSIGVKKDGTLWAWGSNALGQFGNGSVSNSNSPVRKSGNETDWITADAGAFHTVALRRNGTLWSWGAGGYGQLGNASFTDRPNNPVAVVRADGVIESDWVAVSAGAYHTLALKADGTLWAWGSHAHGQLGVITQGSALAVPFPVKTSASQPQDNDWVAIEAGFYHSLALKRDGSVWAWGYNDDGALGNGTRTRSTVPVRVQAAYGELPPMRSIAAGSWHSCALTTGSQMHCWGYNYSGQLGNNTRTDALKAVPVSSGLLYDDIAGGQLHTLALGQDGALYAWGANGSGQLGTGGTAPDVLNPATKSKYGNINSLIVSGPTDGSTINLDNGTVSVSAQAMGQAARIELWVGSTKNNERTGGNVSIPWLNPVPGARTYTVRAIDPQGKVLSSATRTAQFYRFRVTEEAVTAGTVMSLSGTEGALDWFHLGQTSATNITRKSPLANHLIPPNLGAVSGITRRNDFPVGFTWSGGTPTASATNSKYGVAYPAGRSLEYSAKSSTSLRTFKVYATDKNADSYINISFAAEGKEYFKNNNSSIAQTRVYTVTYQGSSASMGNVNVYMSANRVGSGGFSGLQAATLR